MRYPKPQKGNPHKLTIDQHIFPKASISRFTGENGRVQVRRKSGEQDLWLTPAIATRRIPADTRTGHLRRHFLFKNYYAGRMAAAV